MPGRRADPHVVCLAVEGGGMRGAVAAGMCVALERAGLIDAFDRIYGCSSGALSGCYAAAGQAALWAAGVEDAACRAFIDPRRALRGRPVLDLGFLFDTVIAERRPLSVAGLAHGPEFRALAVTQRSAELRVLRDFHGVADLLAAVRASCSLPLLAGPPPTFRGEPMVDGGLLEPIPFRSALRDGATHVLVLRSRPAAWRCGAPQRLADEAAARAHPAVAGLLRSCGQRYNAAAAELEARVSGVAQVAAPPHARLVGRLSTDAERIAASVRLGDEAMTAVLAPAPVALGRTEQPPLGGLAA